MTLEDEATLLECPRCLNIKAWYRATEPAPGECPKCHTRRPWNVIKERRAPGFVKVMSHQGHQFLNGPGFQEDPKAGVKP